MGAVFTNQTFPAAKIKGTGLGLSIVKKLFKLMTSILIVVSTEGVGTEFYLFTQSERVTLYPLMENRVSSLTPDEKLFVKHPLTPDEDYS